MGNLDPSTLAVLLGVLAGYTATADDCWFCVWDGYGWFDDAPPVWATASTRQDDAGRSDELVRLPGREYRLGRGPLRGALLIGTQLDQDWFVPQSPNITWPNDRAWCIASEIDFDSTLVGGPQPLIDELLNTEQLEALVIHPDDGLHVHADQLN